VVRVTDPYGRIPGFLDRSRYFISPLLSSVVLTRLSGPRSRLIFLRKSGSTGNPTHTTGSVARNSDHYSTESVIEKCTFVNFNLGSVVNRVSPRKIYVFEDGHMTILTLCRRKTLPP
jgi:hypothetical protein